MQLDQLLPRLPSWSKTTISVGCSCTALLTQQWKIYNYNFVY